MPIPKPNSGEEESAFISRCISELYNEYGQEQSAGICYSQWRDKDNMSEEEENAQQGGVVSSFARTKFEYLPKAKEKMNDFMARCMSDDMVRERKPNRSMRGGFCWAQYQSNYIGSIGRNWK